MSAVGHGTAQIIATADGKSAASDVVVTAAPLTSAYSVLDLAPAQSSSEAFVQLNDSGVVLAGLLYRNGVGSTIPGCSPIALNNLSHVLCGRTGFPAAIGDYFIWRDGLATPLAASDTFAAQHFRALALNDSDVVAGLYYQPAFSNSNCPLSTTGRRAVLWQNGQPSFPGLMIFAAELTHLTNRLELVAQQLFFMPNSPSSPFLYSASSGQQRPITQFVRAINDQGAMAVERMFVIREVGTFVSTAMLVRPETTVTFGPGAATGINNSGAVVGTLKVGAFLWTSGGVSLLTRAATDAAWTVTRALRINSRGQILAQANNTDGRQGHWVVLTPVTP